MSRSVSLPGHQEPVDGDRISTVFITGARQHRPAETHIRVRGQREITIEEGTAKLNEILAELEQQKVVLIPQPMKPTETADNTRYVAPHLVDFVRVSRPDPIRGMDMTVGVRGGGNSISGGISPGQLNGFIADANSHGKNLQLFDGNEQVEGFTFDHCVFFDPKTNILMEPNHGKLAVYCLGTHPFVLDPVPENKAAGSRIKGLFMTAAALAEMTDGRLIVLPTTPFMYIDPRRVEKQPFEEPIIEGPHKAHLRLLEGTTATKSRHEVFFNSAKRHWEAEQRLAARHGTPSSMLPPPGMPIDPALLPLPFKG